jgi:hypothetical protein
MKLRDQGKSMRLARSQYLTSTMRTMLTAAALVVASAAGAVAGQVDRLYVIDCGWAHAADQSLWSPGINVGTPIDFSDDCYLIHHSSEGYLLWDTGITDRLAAVPGGVTAPPARKPFSRRSLPSVSSPRMCATWRSRTSIPTTPAISRHSPMSP